MVYTPDARPYYDADSHIMELPNFLQVYADPEIRDEMPLVDYAASIVTQDELERVTRRIPTSNAGRTESFPCIRTSGR